MSRISVARGKNYFTFVCDGIGIDPKKMQANVIGGEFDGTIVFGVECVCIEKLVRETLGRNAILDGSIFYAEKEGKEIKLGEPEVKLV